MATNGQLFEEMMVTYHSLGIAGKVAGKSSNTQWAFRQLWKQVRNLTGATLAVSLSLSAMRTHSGIFSSSVLSLSSPSVRPKRNTFVESLAAALRKIQYGATVDRVTADGTVMFELWRAS